MMEKEMTKDMGFEVRVDSSHNDAIEQVTGALKREAFGVVTRIDIDQAFKDKISTEFSPYTILGACNPKLAHAALSSNPEIGLMLPCNVIVEAVDAGCIIRIINPAVMMQMGDMGSDDAVKHVADDATERLKRVADALSRN